jgi:hypothetical protein
MRRWIFVLFPCVASVCLSLPAIADDILDELDRARRAYEQHDFAAALDAADTALKLMRQAQAEAWKAILPEPLPGWTADEAQSNSVAPVLFGGGTSTSRVYRRGADSVEISIVTSSPLILQGIGPFLASGLIFGDETRLVIIDGQKVTYAKGDNTYNMMIADKALIRIKGSRGVNEETLRSYVRGVKIPEIGKAAR